MTQKIAALILAGGRGTRAQNATKESNTAPLAKQYHTLAGKSLLARTLDIFISHPAITHVCVAIRPDDETLFRHAVADLAPQPDFCFGGDTRQQSGLAGLEYLDKYIKPEFVLIHDAARPFVSHEAIDRLLAALHKTQAALLALPLADTIKQIDNDTAHQPFVEKTVDRNRLWAAHTPQAFAFRAILAAHRRAEVEAPHPLTDDAEVAEWAGLRITPVISEGQNRKITTHEDMHMAEQFFSQTQAAPPLAQFRIGSGFDVHAFAPGDHIMLGGIKIPHDQGLQGHSDADVALHALCDAIYGALAEGDIGHHFPPNDKRWHKVSSAIFLEHAMQCLNTRGFTLVNIDITIICETPKIAPWRDSIRAHIAKIAKLDMNNISVKATTSEKLGFTGRKEGIAAQASVMIQSLTEKKINE